MVQHVGICDLSCPVKIPEKGGGLQQTVANVSLTAEVISGRSELAPEALARLLCSRIGEIRKGVLTSLLEEISATLAAQAVSLSLRFPYFIKKKAPVSATPSLMKYLCALSASSPGKNRPLITVGVPVTTLCPCSKEISEAGAHNQRAIITLAVRPKAHIWLEDLVALAERSGSSEVYALLKRPDEKYVTEQAYARPMFVEDVARKVAECANAHPDIDRFSVAVESFESIHAHNAFALVDSDSMG